MNFAFLHRNVTKGQVRAAAFSVAGVLLLVLVLIPALRPSREAGAAGFARDRTNRTVFYASSAPKEPPRAAGAAQSAFDFRPPAAVEAAQPSSSSEPIPLPSALSRPAAAIEPMVIRSATVKLTVKDTSAVLHELSRAAADAGGYVADSRIWREQEVLRAHLTVRVPARGFDQTLAQARHLAKRVDQEQISGQDVTEEFTDLKAQLVNLEATESELRQLLSAVRQRSQKASEVLAIYRELVTVRGQIERIQGRIQYLGNRASYATLDIDLTPEVLAPSPVEPAWKPLASARNALAALLDAFQWLADLATWLFVLVLPLAILVFVPFRLILWLFRQRRNRAIGSAG